MIESDSIFRGAEISLQFRKPLGKGSLSTHCFCFSANFLFKHIEGKAVNEETVKIRQQFKLDSTYHSK